MAGRNLRLMVINDDSTADITVELIDVVMVPHPSENEGPRLQTWEQHLWIWMHREVPDFDLLVVDINFHEDRTDPPYFHEKDGIYTNPLGLLHALPIVGQLTNSNMPFVWAIHSSAKSHVMTDPIAIICYGLLKCMEQPITHDPSLEQIFKNKLRIMKNFFALQLENDDDIIQSPHEVAQTLVRKYRTALVNSCQSQLSLDYEKLDQLQTLANKFADGDSKAGAALAESTLEITSGPATDYIFIRSIFADQKNWTPEVAKKVVVPELRRLSETQPFTDIWPDVKVCMDRFKQIEEKDVYDITAAKVIEEVLNGNNHNDRRARVTAGVILCTVLRCRHRKGDMEATLSVAELLESLNYKHNDFVWLSRQLKSSVFGEKSKLTPARFLAQTLAFPLSHAFLRKCGRQYWKHLTGDSDLSDMPICLQDPKDY
jgi:hypothetical protein